MGPAGAPPETIEGLKAAIATYENRIEQHVKDVAQVGIYWKILATRLMDRKMYGEALKAIEKAVEYYPEDASLQYMEGISAANLAKSIHNVPGSDQIIQREQLFKLAEDAYLTGHSPGCYLLQDQNTHWRFSTSLSWIKAKPLSLSCWII